jgi:hypothetical protein
MQILWTTIHLQKGCTRLAAASDKVYQLLAHGWGFSPGTTASSTTKTCHHDIAESGVKTQKINQIKSIKEASCLVIQLPNSLSHPGPFLY